MSTVLLEKFTPVQASVEILREGADGKDLYMKGIFIQGGVRNHNNRVYPVREIAKAVDQLNEQIRNGESILGEADHPEELTVSIKNASHMITQIYMDGNNGVGKLKILDTPAGQICRAIITGGGKLGVSSRGSGNVDANGNVSDFEIVTIDIVARPSAPEAYPTPIYEALGHRRKGAGAILNELARAVKHDPKAQKHLEKEVMRWINGLKP
jgi:hypothetical protein